jgi:hypothetical protein
VLHGIWSNVAFGIACVILVLLWIGRLNSRGSDRPVGPRQPPSDEVKVLARTPGRKIAAIKLYRDQTGAGLRDAKEVVEEIERLG